MTFAALLLAMKARRRAPSASPGTVARTRLYAVVAPSSKVADASLAGMRCRHAPYARQRDRQTLDHPQV
jgi:hypothetical protein